ncbi:hypothetical protein IWQ60_004460 [Tieghemiomyces parasiticus]|uniref:LITAF domain-containing protein n=1 Tax=Tieghemiomyces parasiticus TaxID=78921 RepID=A0A9W8AG69_9FUNG|nr:hypothetical protein IWQ60_004460 [Tieghemiomyces parasiticus]
MADHQPQDVKRAPEPSATMPTPYGEASSLHATPITEAVPPMDPPAYQPSQHDTTESVAKDTEAFRAAQPALHHTATDISRQNPNMIVRNQPIVVHCPKCQTTVTSVIVPKTGTKGGIAALITCLVCWPVFWIPLVMDSCKDEVHLCPTCKQELGRIPA